mgnify:FL=1
MKDIISKINDNFYKSDFFREGKEVTESDKYSFETDGETRTIIIKNASLEDVAEYTCVAENVKSTTELELEGQEERIEFIMTEVKTETTIKKGEEMTFTLPFSKTMAKKPTMQWFYNGTEIKTSEKVSINDIQISFNKIASQLFQTISKTRFLVQKLSVIKG